MDAPRRIVVLDDDARVRQLIQSALRAPDFEVFAFADGRDALMKLHDIRPDLILSDVWMPDLDGRLFLQVVKRSPALRNVPFVFLTAVSGETAIEAALQAGADGFLMKPFPVALLREKVRAMLGMPYGGQYEVEGNRVAAPEALPAAVAAPPTKPAAALPDSPSAEHSTRRATNGAGETWEAEFAAAREAKGLPGAIEGRFTMATVGGRRVPVLTEAENRPHFTITTLMTSDGRPIRKIETSWQHPLERREDLASAEFEVRLQHEQALATLDKLGRLLLPRRVIWEARNRLVDGHLLCWAVSALVAEARGRFGHEPALGLLRLSWERLRASHEALRHFRIADDGRVLLSQNGGGLVRQPTVMAVAEWAVSFVLASPRVEGETTTGTISRATAAQNVQLQRIGFTGALASAVERLGRFLVERPAPPASSG